MGCFASKGQDSGGNRKRHVNIGKVIVFVPGLRIPKPVDFSTAFSGQLSMAMIERLSSLRSQIVAMSGKEGPTIMRTRRKSSTQHGGSALADLQQALEDYMPILLGLVKEGNRLQHELSFAWMNHEDDAEEHAMANAWYEVLSVLHLMAMLLFYQANTLQVQMIKFDKYRC